jgi:hypothetical protein
MAEKIEETHQKEALLYKELRLLFTLHFNISLYNELKS